MIKRTYKGVEYIGVPDKEVDDLRETDARYVARALCSFCSVGKKIWSRGLAYCPVVVRDDHPMHCRRPRESVVWMTKLDHAAFALGEPNTFK